MDCSPNFNPRSPCGERRSRRRLCRKSNFISIHALLAESDWAISRHLRPPWNFNPRSPCGERLAVNLRFTGMEQISIHALLAESDLNPIQSESNPNPFQSTLSLRRATAVLEGFQPRDLNFNPRSPCGERQQIPPNWPYRFCLKCQFKDGEKSKKAKGSASAQASSPAYEKNKVRIPWGDFECFRFAPIK